MWSRRFAIALCLGWGVRSLGVALTTLLELEQYQALGAAGLPTLRIGIHAMFGLGWWRIAWQLKQKQPQAAHALLLFGGLYLAFQMAWLTAFAQAEYDRARLGFVGVTSALSVGLLWWLSWHLQQLFGEHDG